MSTLTSRFVAVDGSQIHIIESIPPIPRDLPLVVLVTGLGTVGAHWCAVQRLLPPQIHSFAYDRLGLGRSDRTTLPRPATVLAAELKATLIAASLTPPYLLVASSYAGVICREYLEKFDSDVAGLIYVDANQERSHVEREWPMDATFRMDTGGGLTSGPSGLSEDHGCSEVDWEAIKSAEAAVIAERDSLSHAGVQPRQGESASYVTSLAALGDHGQLDKQALGCRPLSIIVANLARDFERSYQSGKRAGLGTADDHEAVETFIKRLPGVELELAVEVLKLSTLHRLIVTSVSGHLVYLWEPELVVQEVLWCLGKCSRVEKSG